ncbi:MAG: hypothetical protein KF773_24475 [Deltaproteobacteria bacterium]|nr:hypothetical protein [Deltaproteobacteria bacterium]
MKRLVCALAASLLVGVSAAHADIRLDAGVTINEDTTPAPLVQQRPRLERMWVDIDPSEVTPAVNSKTIFLNFCQPNGCVVKPGPPNSINNTWNINGQRTLRAFSNSDTVKNAVVMCMRDVFGPFGVEITTTDPAPAAHFEIMIAGRPQDLGMSAGIGGVSPFSCQQFIPNSLVFDFSDVWNGNVEEICSTAAQEIAHSFALDHVTDPSDPLTYFGFNGRRRFKDAPVQCGSDCVQGQSPFGDACSGPNQQNHRCACSGQQTQNSFQTIKALFGDGTPTPPDVRIVQPKSGANVQPGFPIGVEMTDDQSPGRVEFRVDGQLILTAPKAPYAANAPMNLAAGTHTVEVSGFDIYEAKTVATVQVYIGPPCNGEADCPMESDACIGGRCVPGPSVVGGLGSPCDAGPDCASNQCLSDSNGNRHCVEDCELGKGQCPSNFGCLDAGGHGICWPGYDDGTGGGCNAGGAGSLAIGLSMVMLALARRRR